MTTAPAQTSRLESLLRHLERDPGNLALLSDVAFAAYDERAYNAAADAISRYGRARDLPAPLQNLAGMIALAQGHHADAAAAFETLRTQQGDSPALRFNLAWAKAMAGAYREALDLLDEATVAASQRAPALKIEMLHHLDLYEEGLAAAGDLAAKYAGNEALMGVAATLAMDAGDADLALAYARRGQANPEAQAVLGLTALGTHDVRGALSLFDKSIAGRAANPRALIGKGLALLVSGKAGEGAGAIDQGAEMFGDHLGSWVAAGWAHLMAGDIATARQRFDRVVALDGNFAEGHGGLAVLDAMEGRLAEAQRRAEIALRLDRNSLGGALAKSMLLEKGGNADLAKRIRDAAMAKPVGPNGQSIAQALLGFAGAGKRPPSGRPKL